MLYQSRANRYTTTETAPTNNFFRLLEFDFLLPSGEKFFGPVWTCRRCGPHDLFGDFFVIGYHSKFFMLLQLFWPSFFVWLGIVQVFCVVKVWGTTKMVQMNPQESARGCGNLPAFGHPHLRHGFQFCLQKETIFSDAKFLFVSDFKNLVRV